MKLPDFLIVGAGKSGTTSLYYYLNEHPEIFMSEIKEPNFFAFVGKQFTRRKLKPMVVINRIEDYIKLFQPAAPNQKKGEASTYYLSFAKEVISNIKKIYGQSYKKVKIIAILRNPIERAFSEYLMLKSWGEEKLDFATALSSIEKRMKEGWPYEFDYIFFGRYYEPVKAYLENFPKVKIYLFEDLKERPLWLIKDIFEFLGVDSSFVPPDLGKKYNVSGIPKSGFHKFIYDAVIRYNPIKPIIKPLLTEHIRERITNKVKKYVFTKPQMDMETREYLKNIFRDDILKLQALIKRDLSHWLK